ncbi:otoraplin-like [Lampetra planeri]
MATVDSAPLHSSGVPAHGVARLLTGLLWLGGRSELRSVSLWICAMWSSLLCVVLLAAGAVSFDKLSNSKRCADPECSYAISVGEVVTDHEASDCRFLNLKARQVVFVFSKLKPAQLGAPEYWAGSVYNDQYADYAAPLGYFPSKVINETRVFHKIRHEYSTDENDFACDEA